MTKGNKETTDLDNSSRICETEAKDKKENPLLNLLDAVIYNQVCKQVIEEITEMFSSPSKSLKKIDKAISNKRKEKSLSKEIATVIINVNDSLRAYTEEFGKMNRCPLIDTLLSHKAELIKKYVELINALIHREYENKYPLWAEEILYVSQQI